MALLADLPSRGNFTEGAAVTSGCLPVYLCDHDTHAPDSQIINTDPTNILIRSLSLRKKEEAGGKGKAKKDPKGKRPADSSTADGPSIKRPHISKDADADGASGSASECEMTALTVERLKRILRGKGLSTRGKKEELVSRARQHPLQIHENI